MGSVESDLRNYEREQANDEARADAIIRIQEGWDWIIYEDPDHEWCYLIFRRTKRHAPRIEVLAHERNYPTEDMCERIMQTTLDDLAEAELESNSDR